MELSSEKLTVQELLELKKSNMLIVNPEYQRGAVWSEIQQKKLIDSVMRGYPLPLIYLHHKKKIIAGMQSEGLEIIDGQQRINALHIFGEGALKLFDPIQDDKTARFPNFIKNIPCPWARRDFIGLSPELQEKFLKTEIFIVKITTEIEDEARDLFIRLQAGLPLNAQEKRDAWPGGFTELVLKLGGKKEITRFPGHEFFRKIVKSHSTDRGEIRQLCAQICMLLFERTTHGSLVGIGTQAIDDYYYRNLDFSVTSELTNRLSKALDSTVQIFSRETSPKMKGHEAIHVILLTDSLLSGYVKNWQPAFLRAYDAFKAKAAQAKKNRDGEYWFEYGALIQTQSAEARTIQRRHSFFARKMLEDIKPTPLDETRLFGALEREIVYYRDEKKCQVCGEEIGWPELETHHVEEHQAGGLTSVENAVSVHQHCHPKGQKAEEFRIKWLNSKKPIDGSAILQELEQL